MQYLLHEGFIGGARREIAKEEFAEYLSAVDFLRSLWEIEDAFGLVAASFIELEEQMLNTSISEYYIGPLQRAGSFHGSARQTVNLKVVSVLNTARAYEEMVCRKFSQYDTALAGGSKKVTAEFSRVYDESFDYRLVYALRNYAVHHSMPISNVIFAQSNQYETGDPRDEGRSRTRVTFNPFIIIAELLGSDKFNKKVRSELSSLGFEKLDLKFVIRGFIAMITECHLTAREITSELFLRKFTILQNAGESLRETKGSNVKYLSIITLEDGRKVEEHLIDSDHFSYLEGARAQWTSLKYCQNGYVSSEVTKSKDTYPSEHPTFWIPK